MISYKKRYAHKIIRQLFAILKFTSNLYTGEMVPELINPIPNQ